MYLKVHLVFFYVAQHLDAIKANNFHSDAFIEMLYLIIISFFHKENYPITRDYQDCIAGAACQIKQLIIGY